MADFLQSAWLPWLFAALTAAVGWIELFGKTGKPLCAAARSIQGAVRTRRSVLGRLDALAAAIENQSGALESLRAASLRHGQRLDEIAEAVTENEKARLSEILLWFGSRSRRGEALTAEEFRYAQSLYRRYADKLHGNSIISDEYELIRSRFDRQSAPIP